MVMPISDKEYIADLGECMTKLEADLAALREENARLRQRVEELERENTLLHGDLQAAEAKLARVVEALEYLRKANEPHDCPHDWCEVCFIEEALAAAKGGE